MSNFFIKLSILLMSLLMLTSCIYITTNISDKPVTRVGMYCNKYIPPNLGDIPEVPSIPHDLANNKEITDTILVDKIKELREYSKRIKQLSAEAYAEHIASCK